MTPLTELSKARHVGLGGPYGVGKDYVAKQWLPGRATVKVAAPLYRLACLALPGFDKMDPGGRETLQRLGAWGRGEVSGFHPWSAERAAAVIAFRALKGYEGFGSSPDFWLNLFVRGVQAFNLTDTVCTDLRFENEARTFNRELGPALMVLCSHDTLTTRREALGYTLRSDDPSERCANRVMAAVDCGGSSDIKAAVELAGFGGIVWNDPVAHPEVSTIEGMPVYA